MIDKKYKYYLDLLYKSLDFELNESETHELTEAFQIYPELIKEKDALLHLRELCSHLEYPELPANFSYSIMNKVSNPDPVPMGLNQFWIPAIAASVLLLIGVFLVQQHFPDDQINLETLVGLEEISPEDAVTYLDLYQSQ